MYSRVNIDNNGTCQIRYSDKSYPFKYSSESLYEASYGDIGSMFFMMLAGYTGDTKGFVLYRDNDNKDEVLSYTSTSGITVCTVTDVPGLGTMEFRDCLDESPGEQIHEKIADLEF